MKIKSILLGAAILLGASGVAKADKGMWLLNELNKENVERMRELGFTLPLDSLYSFDKPSIANAVVIFGGGCTGITVSEQGLIFTNHHCGYGAIQSQSTVDHDYLRDGFVARTMGEELPIPGLSVKYLRKIEKVTDKVEAQLKGITDEMERLTKAQEICNKLAKEQNAGDNQLCIVEPFYSNNEYFLIVYDVFKDVRMVFAPPSSVGKFGGDTDNWMWPRHTGDFSVFRVYASNNRPAEYSKDNKPYKPVYYAAVSTQGYKADDYAMTIGFPGSTDRYLTSWGVEDRIENENNPRIEVRGIKQAIWKEAMSADQATRIKYASKYAQSANYWKNSIGMNRGLARLDVIGRKRAEEKAFAEWIRKNGKEAVYGDVLPSLEKAYREGAAANKQMTYLHETFFGGTEVIRLAQMINAFASNSNAEARERILKGIHGIYKDYLPSLDRKVLPAMLDVARQHIPADKLPDVFAKVIDKKFKGDTKKYADYVFGKSIIPYDNKFQAAYKQMSADKFAKLMEKDPAVELANSVIASARAIQADAMAHAYSIERGKRLFFAGLREMNPDKALPSDANFTMRMSYGSIKGYEPQDGAWYNYYTTGKGVLEKQDPKSDEFAVQENILDLFRTKNYGPYAENGQLHVAFLSNNDITGGNSGSPVFDKNGRLIGLAFDGNWEAMSGDIEFEPDLQRTISVDIRYVLFMIDKWGQCPRLIQELKLM